MIALDYLADVFRTIDHMLFWSNKYSVNNDSVTSCG